MLCIRILILFFVAYVKSSFTRGIIIDAGSLGSRLHIYKWEENYNPFTITYPTSDESWTSMVQPGIAMFTKDYDKIIQQLISLIHSAMTTLQHESHLWKTYRIYFKATGGMRQLASSERENIMNVVRRFLENSSTNPFYFESEFARIISGEEEAAFSWLAANYLLGALDSNIEGSGVAKLNISYGVLDLGGASTQISFFVPNQDISESLFRIQLGRQKHWNLYATSFLQFGHVSARQRHILDLASRANFIIAPEVL
jgi:Golgi nucleoside diphosphatase